MKETPGNTARSTSGASDVTASIATAGSGCSFRLYHVRTGEALARFGGDEGRLKHWLLDFRTHGAQAVADIAKAIASGDRTVAANLAHALKGRTGMLGMSELHSITQSLELTLRNGEPSGFWLDELTRTLAETQAEINAVLATDQ